MKYVETHLAEQIRKLLVVLGDGPLDFQIRTGVSKSTISHIVTVGQQNMTYENVEKIKALGVSRRWLFTKRYGFRTEDTEKAIDEMYEKLIEFRKQFEMTYIEREGDYYD